MSSLLSSSRLKVHIGDGFAFLSSHPATYDVIITDSSDPVGPASALFSEGYYRLLKGALKDGGAFACQGECVWLHLPLIREIREVCNNIFDVKSGRGVVSYAATTIPTYPSGQIGFLLCSNDPKRDFSKALRKVENCRYWNEEVQKAAFVLPEFGKAMLESGKDLRGGFGGGGEVPAIAGVNVGSAKESGNGDKHDAKKILLLGSGYVAKPCAEYILRDPGNHLTIACRTLSTAQSLVSQLPQGRTSALSLDVTNTSALNTTISQGDFDLVISLIPYIFHASVIRAALDATAQRNGKKTHVVTTSYVNEDMRKLDEEAKKLGVVVMNEIGLDPGIDHLYAVKLIDEVHKAGGKIKEFRSYCGGLPAPECGSNPLGYKFSWSSRGVLLALLNNASFLSSNQVIRISGRELMKEAKPYYVSPPYAFVGYPNRDSTGFREWYNIPEAGTVVRGTLRYQGFPEFIKALVDMGFLDGNQKDWLKEGMDWKNVTAKALGAEKADQESLVKKVREVCQFESASEESRIVSGLKWIGLFSDEKVVVRAKNLLDILCARLETLMAYEDGERDFVLLQHKFVVEHASGKVDTITSTLEQYGAPVGSGGHSAMAVLVGVPCGIATQLVLDGVIKRPGVIQPYDAEICEPIRALVEKEGLGMVERVL